jgi:hypothetical protein
MGGSAGDVRVPPPTVRRPRPRPRSDACARPVEAPTPYSQKIQAENATLHNISVVTYIPGYEGTGHADWFRSGLTSTWSSRSPAFLAGQWQPDPALCGIWHWRPDHHRAAQWSDHGNDVSTFAGDRAGPGRITGDLGVSFNAGTNTVRLIPEYSGYTFIDYAQFDQLTGAASASASAPAPTRRPPLLRPGSGARLGAVLPLRLAAGWRVSLRHQVTGSTPTRRWMRR